MLETSNYTVYDRDIYKFLTPKYILQVTITSLPYLFPETSSTFGSYRKVIVQRSTSDGSVYVVSLSVHLFVVYGYVKSSLFWFALLKY